MEVVPGVVVAEPFGLAVSEGWSPTRNETVEHHHDGLGEDVRLV